jgi:hypothetical protein
MNVVLGDVVQCADLTAPYARRPRVPRLRRRVRARRAGDGWNLESWLTPAAFTARLMRRLEPMPAFEPVIVRFDVAIATEVAPISAELRAVVAKLARTGSEALVGAELLSVLAKLGAVSANAMFIALLALMRSRQCE